jgi:hypothetical protein
MTLLLAVLVLGAVGFAAASIVGGESASSADTTGTTGTTGTTPQTVIVTTTQTVTKTVTVPRVVLRVQTAVLCHRTGSGRFVTIRVRATVAALSAHLRHGDLSGRCTAAKIRLIKKHLAHRG